MRSRVSLDTPGRPLSTFETVEIETSASVATSDKVARARLPFSASSRDMGRDMGLPTFLDRRAGRAYSPNSSILSHESMESFVGRERSLMISSVSSPSIERVWQNPAYSPVVRVDTLIAAMTLREKVAQLYGLWVGVNPGGPGVAPHQSELENGHDFGELIEHGLGQITRAFGTNPVDAADGAAALARMQREIVAANRFGIPALVHEECLAGFTTWGATAYPVPLSWGATFDPELVRQMATRIGAGMRAVGVHQGLAPVLDVVRDLRWGRVEETIGEDPYLIGTIATAYVQGLQSTGIVATLKHFAGYSASRAGRNLAPVSMGPREFADVVLPPFEMAVVEGGVHSVMHSYAEVDGVPAAGNHALLTELLRDTWGFNGTVVADYFGVSFLKLLHGVAATFGEAATTALSAGVDVELPGPKAYLPLPDEVESGRIDEAVIDRALRRVLRQKLELGLLGRRLVTGAGRPRRGSADRRRTDPRLDRSRP